MTITDLDKPALMDLVQQQNERIAVLERQLRLLLRQKYQPSSEQLSEDQLALFEPESVPDVQTDPSTLEDDDTITVRRPQKRRGKWARCDDTLARHRIEYELPESERLCGCGETLVKIGETVTEQYEFIPAQYIVIEQVQHRYGCCACHAPSALKTAPKPLQILPKTNATVGLLAQIVTAKYVDGTPLHRQQAQHDRGGIYLPRNTMARWLIHLSDEVQPLLNLFEDSIRAGPYTHCDESPIQVLKEPDRDVSKSSWVWVRQGGLPGQDVVLYHYSPHRSSEVAKSLFKDYQGFVQCDGYAAYHCLETQGITLVGCMAHARRKFTDALKQLSRQEAIAKSKAATAIAYFKALYQIEADARDQSFTDDQRYQQRQDKAVPLLAEFKAWLEAQTVLPKSTLGKAIQYTLKQWPRLIRYCEHGFLDIDNNANERAIRPFATGRKNWMFADTPRGAQTNARFYSLIETCKFHGHEPYAYLKYLFKALPKATCVEDYEALLPWHLNVSTVREMVREI
ncbi:IS66 family transposase [Marinomonas transparens]|uniref:IS66 family transposase n=1 Tax=Marinomonas transparens TaxID=2795388 RepID=A0A934N1U3_9GAMM|nr:IS66 family transposase [Marinomonas transparens]MBJ7537083.1 IS66 family transposase [Marinomonas transparens]